MTLQAAFDQYIAWRREQGAVFGTAARWLHACCRSIGNETDCAAVRPDQASKFIDGDGQAPHARAQKHSALAGFYRYAVPRGLVRESPLPAERPPKPPSGLSHIYSRDELSCLLDAVETERKRATQLEPHTFRALLLTLYGAGLRHGEALRLTVADVDLPAALLTVRDSKFKTRWVPLGAQLAGALERYAAQRAESGASSAEEAAFFVNRDGSPLVADTVRGAFARLRRVAGVGPAAGESRLPRLHDLRHSFAVHRLLAWYRQDLDLQRMLPLLSVYLGHASLTGTQVYLRMTTELLDAAAARFERYAEGGCDA